MNAVPCTREGCNANETGVCLEGFDSPIVCPYTGGEGASFETKSDDAVAVHSADALSEDEANAICRSGSTRVVLLAGPISSGKTTIITSLYESFLEAPYGNYLFAGSQTLVGFERRCHLARIASRGQLAQTSRTPSAQPNQFLHLCLARAGAQQATIHILLADISGEVFRQVRDSSEAQRRLPFIDRVDRLAIVLDGERLADPLQRQLPRNDARTLLRAFVESGRVHSSCRVNVVFAKWDKLQLAATADTDTEAFLADTKRSLLDVSNGAALSFFEVAARPEAPSPPFAYGLATLLREWVEVPDTRDKPILVLSDARKAVRESDRYASGLQQTTALEAFHVERY
jgi:hypothetical protein